MKLKLMTLVVMLGVTGRVDAYTLADQLLAYCESKDISSHVHCGLILDAFANGADAWGHVDEIGNLFCKPDEVKSGN